MKPRWSPFASVEPSAASAAAKLRTSSERSQQPVWPGALRGEIDLGAASEQEENGLGASAGGPGEDLTQNVPLGSTVVSQKVKILGQQVCGGSAHFSGPANSSWSPLHAGGKQAVGLAILIGGA
jgi:hypothetical protein